MVNRVRDGKSYSMRHVAAIQNGQTIFTCHISYHKEEADSIRHQQKMPEVSPPEDLVEAGELLQHLICALCIF